MRKLYIAFLFLLSFTLYNVAAKAQTISTYVFAPATSTFTALTGATASTAVGDDGLQNIPIGFNFSLGGVAYTNVIISTNGVLKLVNDASTTFDTHWTNNLSNTYNAAIIAPLWEDNNATGGTISYLLAGTAPNRTLTVEWNNIHISGTGSPTNPTGSFQAVLFETSNNVRFVYGTINTLTGASISIGLNDLVSFLSVTPAATATASSLTANNTIANATNIPSGTTYNFFPPPPCAPASLNGGTSAGPAGSVCPGTPFSITITGASFGTGLTYQWESSPDGTTWTDIAGATGVTLNSYTPSTAQFRRKTICSGTTAASTISTVTIVGTPVSILPWTENFDGLATIGLTSFPPCWYKANGDWATRNAAWTTRNDPRSAPNYLTDSWSATDEFIWTVGFQLTAGTSYDFSFWFSGDGVNGWTGDVFVNNGQSGTGATQLGGSFITAGITSIANLYAEVRRTFVPSANGVYYFGVRVNATGAPFYLAFDDFRMETTPQCSPSVGLSVSGLTTTSTILNWLASITPPAGGYEWEVRTSGAGGSGATGLAASGVTGAGVLTANAAGLLPNTNYTFYVRSACIAGTLFSSWSTGFAFITPCNAITAFPYTETFETSSTTRSCWNPRDFVTGALPWAYGAGSGNGGTTATAHGGALNAQLFGANTGAVTRLVSPALNLSSMTTTGADLVFWYVNEDWLGDQNELRVYYKTSAAGTWTLIPGAVYTTNVGSWTEVEIANLPNISGDYYIAFEGVEVFGRGVAIDDVSIKAAPTCRKVTAVNAFSPTPTSAVVSFTSLGNSFVVEYGAPGFVPGTTNTAGAGTVVFGAASPITINGLTAGNNYDIYVRRICVPGVDFSENVKTTVTTLCAATNIPYVQNFESSVMPNMPLCTSMQDVNGNSGPEPNVGGGRWVTFVGASNQVYVSPTNSLRYLYDFANLSRGADDWFFIQGLNLTAGTTYRLKFYYKGSNGPTWIEKLEVKYGTQAQASAMTNTLYTNNNIATALANPWDSARVDFTPATTGVYYLGFHATSLPDQAFLYLDDISVRQAPLVDVGVTGIVGTLPTCPAPNTVVKATVYNYNLTALNFATYPVTVTANITGAATATLTTTVSTGTLAPGASLEVSLPAYSFAAGLYNITYTTSQANDPETGNNSYSTSVYVNPSPAIATFTPADPRSCAVLSTQFTTPPPAPVALPAVSSGVLNLPIPDGINTGVTSTLAVSGVPAGAVVTAVSVTLNITHTWNSDVIANLRAPNGKVFNLVNGTRGGSGDNFVDAIISSASTTILPNGNVTITGTYAADGTTGIGPTGFVSDVAAWAGLYAIGNGNWTLAVMDDAGLDVGTLNSWSITVTYGTPHPVVTWSPTTGLFTDAAGTIPYVAGTNAYAVYSNPAAATTYTVTSTSSAGCTSSSTVTVKPLVDITAFSTKICISDEVVPLNAVPAGGVWSGIGVSGNNFIPPATAIGSYDLTYRYTNASGCTSVNVVNAKVVDCPERIILLRDNAVILYPNPNTGRFNVRINSVLYNKLTMRVYNTAGAVVHSRQLTGLAFNRVIPIDLTMLPQGAYMVQFYYDGGVRTSDKVFPVIIGR